MSVAREEILQRVREALGPAADAPPVARDYRRRGSLGTAERTALFCERVGAYEAEVQVVGAGDIGGRVAAICSARGARTLVVPDGVPAGWCSPELRHADGALSARELDGIDGAVTGCTAAIAETGTIVLAGGAKEGRRALTLVPDLHICVVEEPQIVELVPEAFVRLAELGLERRPLTFISGPSATSDIELSRVEGVHGPRDLVVLVVTAD